MKRNAYSLAICASALLALLPFIALWALHGPYTIVPEFMDDSAYYYARMEAVARGFWFIGNPYFLEHVRETAAAFFGADWIAALPLLLGIPLLPAAILNAVVWMALLCALLIWLYGLFDLSRSQRAWFSLLTVLGLFWYMERPVAMQVVYPSFVFLLGAYGAWLRNPTSRARAALLSFAAALTFYLYTYEWQITVIVFGLTHLLLLIKWRSYRSLLLVDAAVFIIALPMLLYTAKELGHPWYWETVRRIGYVPTHTFGSAAVIIAVQIVGVLFGAWLLRVRLVTWQRWFILFTGASILIATFSNVITGKDLETAVHIGRFADAWVLVVGLLLCARAWQQGRSRSSIVTGVIALAAIASVLIPSVLMTNRISSSALEGQRYAPVLTWLNEHTEPGSVVLADDRLSYFIPAETQDYVLFQPDGGLYLVPDSEVVERYEISRMLATISLAQVESEYRAYAGAGNAIHAYKIANRESTICNLFRRAGCGGRYASAIQFKGEDYFRSIYARSLAIAADPLPALETYHVSYVITDEGERIPEKLSGFVTKEAQMGGFAVYRINR